MKLSEIRKLPKLERDRLRRAQIVEAAVDCVIRHGFHKATTAMIAKEAGFSEGQIYRYFGSKEDIIAAIAETQTVRHLERIIATRDSRELAEKIAGEMADNSEEKKRERIMFLEMQAEATRNPVVADILKQSELKLRAKAVETMLADFPRMSGAEAVGIIEFLATMNQGRIFRAGQSNPETTAEFIEVYKAALAYLLSGYAAEA